MNPKIQSAINRYRVLSATLLPREEFKLMDITMRTGIPTFSVRRILNENIRFYERTERSKPMRYKIKQSEKEKLKKKYITHL